MTGTDAYVKGPADSTDPTGKKIDNDVLTIGADDVYRQRVRTAGAAAAELADVRNADPSGTDYGVVARLAGTVPLPTGAATEAKQDTEIAGLATIAANQTTELSSLASLVAKDYATQTTLAALFAALGLAQGTAMTGATGPMVQGIVSDTPQSYNADVIQPLSLTAEGRLRVSTVSADINKVWQHNDANPWDQDNPYAMEESLYV